MSTRAILVTQIQNIVHKFHNVHINNERLQGLVPLIIGAKPPTWTSSFVYSGPLEKRYTYFLLFSALSFYYWRMPKWFRRSEGESLGGSESMFYFLTDAIQKGYDFTDAEFMKEVEFNHFCSLIQGEDETEISMVEERFAIVREIGRVLSANYEGSFWRLCVHCAFDANRIVEELVTNFSCFRDEATYEGNKLFFWKKAQEAITLIDDNTRNEGKAQFTHLEDLTASADYKIPQVLISLGALEISESLHSLLMKQHVFIENDPMVIELRALTILAVDILAQQLPQKASEISTILWSLAQDATNQLVPYPRIVSSCI